MNPKQMAQIMKQMGIKNEPVDALKVVVYKADGSQMVVEPAQVILVEMQGQKSLQVSGTFIESSGNPDDATPTDLDLIMDETGCSKVEAQSALDESKGDLAEAILKLKKE
ncbi:nascent polypeptide-associated complex protein [Candidatus Micrarchaeota archaeon]|nr:nascent polypeptide-associated complex protein [Candidatus Micrarchaeota archaeon]